uniref:Uncharacterized protein n=1 Tax=Amphimedon queenslandica TaxID=400682 RepID=A0A1X7U2F2_AMPQE
MMASTEFPEFLFPVCHVKEEYIETTVEENSSSMWGFHQRLNQVEYGNLSAFVLNEREGGEERVKNSSHDELHYRNGSRDQIVHYLTSPLPLLPPNATTPYDFVLKSDKINLTKKLVDNQYRYFKLKFPHTYVPVKTLITNIKEAVISNHINEDIEPCQGSVVEYVPSLLGSDEKMEGYLIFAGGPNLNELNITVLSHHTDSNPSSSDVKDYESFYQYINESGSLRPSCAETHRMPGRIREIDSAIVNERIFVAVRTGYYIALFDGPSKSTEKRLRRKWKSSSVMSPSPVTLLKSLKVYQTPALTSSISICPYIYGECLFMIETGGLYLWSFEGGIKEIQSPLCGPSSLSHLWRCVWGPHLFSAVVLEHNCVSLVEFRNDKVTHTYIIDRDSKYMSSNWITSAIVQHPIQPFYIFIATTDKVLLFDLRQLHEPVLEIRHEISKTIHYLGVACFSWQPEVTSLMMSSLHGPQCQVVNIRGGYNLSEEKVLPPRISMTLHAVDTYSTFCEELNLSSSLLYCRLTQSLAGACFVPLLSSQSHCAVFISSKGDLFYQSWLYGAPPPKTKPVVPHLPSEVKLWVEEALKMEREVETTTVGLASKEGKTNDFELIFDYLPDEGLCLKCATILPLEGIRVEPHPPPPTNGTSILWRCSFCLERQVLRRYLKETESLDVDTTGIEYLQKVAGISNETDPKSLVSEYDELCDLWDKWDTAPEPENENETPGGEGGKADLHPIKEEGMEDSQSKASQSRTN